MMKRRDLNVEHPRFDKMEFEVVFDPADRDAPAVRVLTTQGRELLEVMAREARRRKGHRLSGARLREVLEAAREERFPRTRQSEIFRIFQDYRARFVRAGFLKVLEVE